MNRFILVLMFLCATSIFASSPKSNKINIEHLILSVEALANDLKLLEGRMNKISDQSYGAALSAKEHEILIETLKDQIAFLTNEIKEYKRESNKSDLSYGKGGGERATGRYYFTTARNGLKIRSSAAISSEQIDLLPYNTLVYAECSTNSQWCYLPDRHAFAFGEFLRAKGKK